MKRKNDLVSYLEIGMGKMAVGCSMSFLYLYALKIFIRITYLLSMEDKIFILTSVHLDMHINLSSPTPTMVNWVYSTYTLLTFAPSPCDLF